MPAHTMLNVAFVLNWNRSAVSCDSFILFCFSCMKETKMKQKNMFAISEPTYDHLLMYAKSQKTTKYENPTQFQYSSITEMKLFPFRFHSFNEFLFYAICLYIDFQFISLKIWETNIECVSAAVELNKIQKIFICEMRCICKQSFCLTHNTERLPQKENAKLKCV